MVKRINSVPPKHTQGTGPTQKNSSSKVSSALERVKAAVEKYVVKGPGKSALGAGNPPTFSPKAPQKSSSRVAQAVKGSSVLPSSKKRSR